MKIAQLHKLLFFQFLTHFIPFFKLKYFFKYLIYINRHINILYLASKGETLLWVEEFLFFYKQMEMRRSHIYRKFLVMTGSVCRGMWPGGDTKRA